MTSRDFVSPIVSDQIETLRRRHKRQAQHHPQPQRERPALYYPQYGGQQPRQQEQEQGQQPWDGGGGDDDDALPFPPSPGSQQVGAGAVVAPEPTGIVLDGGLGGLGCLERYEMEEAAATANRRGGLVEFTPAFGSGVRSPSLPLPVGGDGGGEWSEGSVVAPAVFLSSSTRKLLAADAEDEAAGAARMHPAHTLAPLPPQHQQQQHQSFRPAWSSGGGGGDSGLFPAAAPARAYDHPYYFAKTYAPPPMAPPLPLPPSPPPPPFGAPSWGAVRGAVNDENDESSSGPLYAPVTDAYGGGRPSPPRSRPSSAGSFAPPFLTHRQAAAFGGGAGHC